MKRISALIAFSSAMALATAASAQVGGGLVGGATGQVGAVTGAAQGAVNASPRAVDRANPKSAVAPTPPADVTDTTASASRQGPVNASPTAAANANANAGLASAAAPDLSALKTGQTVRDAAGTTLGTVSKIERAADGTVQNVLVAGADGQKKVMRLAPGSLSISGDIVTTTSADKH